MAEKQLSEKIDRFRLFFQNDMISFDDRRWDLRAEEGISMLETGAKVYVDFIVGLFRDQVKNILERHDKMHAGGVPRLEPEMASDIDAAESALRIAVKNLLKVMLAIDPNMNRDTFVDIYGMLGVELQKVIALCLEKGIDHRDVRLISRVVDIFGAEKWQEILTDPKHERLQRDHTRLYNMVMEKRIRRDDCTSI